MYCSKMGLAVAVCRCSSVVVSTEFEVVENLLGQHVCTVDRFDVREASISRNIIMTKKSVDGLENRLKVTRLD